MTWQADAPPAQKEEWSGANKASTVTAGSPEIRQELKALLDSRSDRHLRAAGSRLCLAVGGSDECA